MKIIILDFNNDRVFVKEVPGEIEGLESHEVAEKIADQLGIKDIEDCEYMVSDFVTDDDDNIRACDNFKKCKNIVDLNCDAYYPLKGKVDEDGEYQATDFETTPFCEDCADVISKDPQKYIDGEE